MGPPCPMLGPSWPGSQRRQAGWGLCGYVRLRNAPDDSQPVTPFVEGPVASGSGRADPGVGIFLGGSLVSFPVYLLDLQAAFPGGLGCVPCICVMV